MNKEILEKIEKLENEAKELREQLEKKKKGRWVPKEGKEYFISSEASGIKYENDSIDKISIELGDCYKTKELARRQAEKEKLIVEIWDWWYENDGVELDWGNEDMEVYEILYEYTSEVWKATKIYLRSILSVPVFSSEKLAKACIKHFGDRLDILLTKRWEE